MCARILQQCEQLRGGRENLAAFLEVKPGDLAAWIEGDRSATSGPPRAVFEKAMEVILAEHDRRAKMAPAPKRRRGEH